MAKPDRSSARVMIPLRLVASIDAPAPFVTRLRSSRSEGRCHPLEATLTAEKPSPRYTTCAGPLVLTGANAAELDGDVLFVDPQRRLAHRWIRAASHHNTLLVTEQCDQLCVMCSQPPKRHHVDLFPYLEAAALLAPGNAVIGVSGGEPTLHKDSLFAMLERVLASRPDLSFHVLTNAQHFDATDQKAITRVSDSVVWGVPIYSWNADQHDTIVGKPGAHGRLLDGLALLCTGGAPIELRTVVTKANVGEIPRLARFIANRVPFVSSWAIMQVERIGFGRMNWADLFVDTGREFGSIGAAIDLAQARGIDVRLYNFPLCTVPEAYRSLAGATISDWKTKYLAACQGCRLRAGCGGFFQWHPEDGAYSRLGVQ